MKYAYWIITLLLSLCSTTLFAAFIAEVDRDQITQQDIFTLTLTSDGNQRDNPDLSVLQKQFDIISRSSSSQVSVINGQMKSTRQWLLQLAPKRTGRLKIPSIPLGRESSNPIFIMVLDRSQSQPPSRSSGDSANSSNRHSTEVVDGGVEMDVTLSQSSAYVQEEVIMTVKVRHSVSLSNATLSDLSIDDAVIEKLSNTKSYTEKVKGQQVNVVEQSFALYPLSAGTLTIPQVTLDATVITRHNRSRPRSSLEQLLGNSLSSRHGQPIRRVHPSIELNVKPIPSQYPKDQPWLPAKSVSLADTWQPANATFTVGEPTTRITQLKVEGQHSSFLPKLPIPTISGIKIYSDQDQTKHEPNDNPLGFIAIRQDAHAFLPTKAGKFSVPATEIIWWNTKRDRLERSKVRTKSISVKPSPDGHTSHTNPVVNVQPEPAAPPASDIEPDTNTNGPSPSNNTVDASQLIEANHPLTESSSHRSFSLWLLFIILLGAVLTFLIVQNIRLNRRIQSLSVTSPDILAGTQPESKTIPLKSAHKQLLTACEEASLTTIKAAVIDWFRAALPEQSIRHLGDVMSAINLSASSGNQPQDEALQTVLATLEKRLYSTEKERVVSDAFREQLKQAIEGFNINQLVERQKVKENETLRPIYPS